MFQGCDLERTRGVPTKTCLCFRGLFYTPNKKFQQGCLYDPMIWSGVPTQNLCFKGLILIYTADSNDILKVFLKILLSRQAKSTGHMSYVAWRHTSMKGITLKEMFDVFVVQTTSICGPSDHNPKCVLKVFRPVFKAFSLWSDCSECLSEHVSLNILRRWISLWLSQKLCLIRQFIIKSNQSSASIDHSFL